MCISAYQDWACIILLYYCIITEAENIHVHLQRRRQDYECFTLQVVQINEHDMASCSM